MTAAVTNLAPVVAVYVRVSTGEQHVENQEPDIQKLIAARYPTSKVLTYQEKASATKNKRPIFKQMLADARAGAFQVLVIWKLDRFGRTMLGNQQDVVELDKLGVRLISTCDSWLDTTGVLRNMLIAQFSGIAEMEIDNLRMRTKNGLARIRAAGGVPGSVCFGLTIVRDRDALQTPRAAIDEAKRSALIQLAHAFVEARSYRGAAMRMNAADASPANTNAAKQKRESWTDKRVRRVLAEERLRTLGAWPAELLSQIDLVVAECETREHVRGAAERRHLASSFLACGLCGHCMTAKSVGPGRVVYVCSTRVQRGKTACPGVGSRPKEVVERTLVQMILPTLTGEIRRQALELAREELGGRTDVASERDGVQAALDQATRDGKTLVQLALKTGNAESVAEQVTDNDKLKKQLRTRLARLEASPGQLDARQRLATIAQQLSELGDLLVKGDIHAAPAVRAVLQGARLSVLPILIDGVRRWGISGWISSGYVLGLEQPAARRNGATQGSVGRSPRT